MAPRTVLAVAGLAAAAAVGASIGSPVAPPPGVTRAAPGPPPTSEVGEGRWAWPLDPRPQVLHPFVAPRSRYGPGHRGLDLAGPAGARVTAVADGVVTHRGRIAGRGTITVTHPDGIRSTYEPVDSALATGTTVRRGQAIATLTDEPGHCTPATCLHLGALRGRDYLDPLPFFGSRRIILLPMG